MLVRSGPNEDVEEEVGTHKSGQAPYRGQGEEKWSGLGPNGTGLGKALWMG